MSARDQAPRSGISVFWLGIAVTAFASIVSIDEQRQVDEQRNGHASKADNEDRVVFGAAVFEQVSPEVGASPEHAQYGRKRVKHPSCDAPLLLEGSGELNGGRQEYEQKPDCGNDRAHSNFPAGLDSRRVAEAGGGAIPARGGAA